MKKISIDEEFSCEGHLFMFTKSTGKLILKNLGTTKSKSKPSFIPPTLDEVKFYFKEKGYTLESAEKFHEYYSTGDWKDGKGNPVKNWKQKALAVWFTDKNKQPKQAESKESKFMFGK